MDFTIIQTSRAFEEICAKGEAFNHEFIETIIKISSELHNQDVIKKIFGNAIPIIIHELEYYEKPVNWTKKGNPKGNTKDFINWVENM